MNRMFAKTLLLLAIWLLLTAIAGAEEPLAVVTRLEGTVRHTEAGTVKEKAVRRGQVLYDGDRLKVGESSLCVIRYLDDRSQITLRENAACLVNGVREGDHIDKKMTIFRGSYHATLPNLKGSFQVITPTSTASVKGTNFWILQPNQSGETRYICTEGTVEVANEQGKILLREGQTATVESSEKRAAVKLTDSSEIPSERKITKSLKYLDIEFVNDKNEQKILRIQIQE